MNWGTKLIIGMLCFMSFIIVLAVLMINSKPDALVDTDYYEKGLDYDKDYNRKEQVKSDNAAPSIRIAADHIVLLFKNKAEGDIKLVRNADQRMDKKISIQTDSAKEVRIPLKGIEKGQWRLIISWTTEGKAYLNEQELIIP
ncbi:nitrogen fixation protein FixH [Pedobacter hiemivivus]|uniref:Nitrogen fixation protein FixH n=1 Tax=Pedobacter hiemivivus TaxID=2530454 RepID=A0A4U1G8S8_9SPHI|nr:FixH family protein [Pedobacter hiemivivus]TCC97070.1 nitrogen fixation protein FixH [Pedobacter hiemivivus]TKC59053.1 nitrogen fixation protein FixH [Pedobacter hiemivivus]